MIGSDNGLSPVQRQPIIWTDDGLLSIRLKRTYFNEISFEFQWVSFKKIHMKMLSTKMAAILSQPKCVLNQWQLHALKLKYISEPQHTVFMKPLCQVWPNVVHSFMEHMEIYRNWTCNACHLNNDSWHSAWSACILYTDDMSHLTFNMLSMTLLTLTPKWSEVDCIFSSTTWPLWMQHHVYMYIFQTHLL